MQNAKEALRVTDALERRTNNERKKRMLFPVAVKISNI